MDLSIKKISLQCRRGMLELDFFLRSFVQEKYPNLSDKLKKQFEKLLKNEDIILYQWFMKSKPPPMELQEIVTKIIIHAKN